MINAAKHTIEKVLSKYPVHECFNVLKGMFTSPTYKELTFTSEAWAQMNALINLVGEYEINGFGRIQSINGKDYITELKILKQEVKAAYVKATEDAVMDFIRETPEDQRAEWVLDWHSHVNMSTGPSGTDWNNYEDMLSARMGNQFPFMIVNKKGEITCMQYISENRQETIKVFIDQTPIPESRLLEIYNTAKEEVENKCTKYVYVQNNVATTYKPKVYRAEKKYQNPLFPSNNSFTQNPQIDEYEEWENWGEYNNAGRHWWEDEDDDVLAAQQQGYVFEDDDEEELCLECGAPIDMKDPEQLTYCACKTCIAKMKHGLVK